MCTDLETSCRMIIRFISDFFAPKKVTLPFLAWITKVFLLRLSTQLLRVTISTISSLGQGESDSAFSLTQQNTEHSFQPCGRDDFIVTSSSASRTRSGATDTVPHPSSCNGSTPVVLSLHRMRISSGCNTTMPSANTASFAAFSVSSPRHIKLFTVLRQGVNSQSFQFILMNQLQMENPSTHFVHGSANRENIR